MARSQHRSGGIIVGVDAGGTWVRIRAQADSRPIAALTQSASAVPELATFLHSLWRRRGWTRPRVDALVVAARGVWLPRERRALRRRLTGLARRVSVIADVEAAWHATLGAECGVLVLSGTGSIALGRDARGRWARGGGARTAARRRGLGVLDRSRVAACDRRRARAAPLRDGAARGGRRGRARPARRGPRATG